MLYVFLNVDQIPVKDDDPDAGLVRKHITKRLDDGRVLPVAVSRRRDPDLFKALSAYGRPRLRWPFMRVTVMER